MRERFREAPRELFDAVGDAFGCRFRSKRGPWQGTITQKTEKAVKKTSDGERTTIIFGKFKSLDALNGATRQNIFSWRRFFLFAFKDLRMAKILRLRFSRSSHEKDFSSSLLNIFS